MRAKQRRGLRPACHAVAAAALVALAGCAGDLPVLGVLDPGAGLNDAQRRYTRLMRWAEFTRASEFVAPDERAAFLERAAELADVRFTDYELYGRKTDPELGETTLRVTYTAYRLSSATETVFDERQVWYRDEETRAWLVRSELAERTSGAPTPSS